MGYISLENDDIPEIGISFLPEFQGKGFGTIACRLLIAQTKEELGISVYTVRIDPTNEKCIKMVAKLGAKKVDSRPSPFMKSLKSLIDEDKSKQFDLDVMSHFNESVLRYDLYYEE